MNGNDTRVGSGLVSNGEIELKALTQLSVLANAKVLLGKGRGVHTYQQRVTVVLWMGLVADPSLFLLCEG